MTSFKHSEDYQYTEHPVPHGIINGVAVSFFTTPALRNSLRNEFKLRPETDIFIVTYPKSGTTWMQSILREMLFGEDAPEWAALNLTDRLPFLDHVRGMTVRELENMPNPRVFKCHNHSPDEMDDLVFKGNRKQKIIYVIRDPRDVSVSLHYQLKCWDWFSKASFTEYFQNYFRDGRVVFYGLWEDHVNNWLSSREEYDILAVKFEDLIADSCKEIARIARFVGRDLDPETVRQIAEKTSFGSMKKKGNLFKDQNRVSDSCLRKGTIGDWKNHFVDMGDEEMMRNIANEVYEKHQIS